MSTNVRGGCEHLMFWVMEFMWWSGQKVSSSLFWLQNVYRAAELWQRLVKMDSSYQWNVNIVVVSFVALVTMDEKISSWVIVDSGWQGHAKSTQDRFHRVIRSLPYRESSMSILQWRTLWNHVQEYGWNTCISLSIWIMEGCWGSRATKRWNMPTW